MRKGTPILLAVLLCACGPKAGDLGEGGHDAGTAGTWGSTGAGSTGESAVCGNGQVEGDEQCDDGNTDNDDGCTVACASPRCGDGFVQGSRSEVCDDGNEISDDGCDADCVPSGVVGVDAGNNLSCATFRTGNVRCWGVGGPQLGHLGEENIGDDEVPGEQPVINMGARVMETAAGGYIACAHTIGAEVRCWGTIWHGYPGVMDVGSPAGLGSVDLGVDVAQLVAGGMHACVLSGAGTVHCWGHGRDGALGYGNVEDIGDDEPPSAAGAVDVGGKVVSLAAGWTRTCAILEGGGLRCWGNCSGFLSMDPDQLCLGYGDVLHVGDDEVPADMPLLDVGGPVRRVALGNWHSCVLLEDGGVRCWGTEGPQLGYPGVEEIIGDDEAPGSLGNVDFGSGEVVDMVAGGGHTCVLLEAGAVRCWGHGAYGALGYGNEKNVGEFEPPAAAGDVPIGERVAAIRAGFRHTLVLTESGGVRGFGESRDGELGYGNTETIGDDETPAEAGDISVFSP